MKSITLFIAFFLSAPTFAASIAYVYDFRTTGVDGGTCAAGSWIQRDLNTLPTSPPQAFASLSGNTITLQPGTYDFNAQVPAFAVGKHKAKLVNVSTGTDVLIGSSEVAPTSGSESTYSGVYGVLTLKEATKFAIYQQCTSTKTGNGFGVNTGASIREVYTQIRIVQL